MKRHAKQEKNAEDPKIKNLFLSSMVCLNLLWCYLLFFISFFLSFIILVVEIIHEINKQVIREILNEKLAYE